MTTLTGRTPAWAEIAVSRLRDAATCPVCDLAALAAGRCRACGADLTVAEAVDLWDASLLAADALVRREELRQRIPRTAGAYRVTAPVTSAVAPATSDAADATATAPNPVVGAVARPARGATTVQSVLAVAGAGLFAVAAIVFTFFNPDLSDHGVRSLVTAAVTLAFLAAAHVLAGRGLRSSAEAVGGLGMVFVALDVYAFAAIAPPGVSAWVFAAVGTVAAGTVMLVLAVRSGIRTWLAVAAAGLAAAPAMLGAAHAGTPGLVTGWIATMGAAMTGIVVIQRTAPRFASSLTAETVALTVMQIVAALAALTSALGLTGSAGGLLAGAAALGSIALVARLSARRFAAALWSLACGGLAAAAGGAAAMSLAEAVATMPALYPVALLAGPALGFLVVTVVLPPSRPTLVPWTTVGALLVVGLCALAPLTSTALGSLTHIADAVIGAAPYDGAQTLGGTIGIGLAAAAFALHGRVERARRDTRPGADSDSPEGATGWSPIVSAWLAAAATAAASALAFPEPWMNVATGATLASAFALIVRSRGRMRASVRVPLLLGGYAALVIAVAVSWESTQLAVIAAPAALTALVLLAGASPARTRWAHLGAGYSYALIAVAAALSLADQGEVAVMSLTTVVGALVAICATFLPRVGARAWWTILVVTAVPFVLGILQVVRERSGWTALSTGLIFLLALTLVLTRRPGLVPVVRAACAAVLVPSLAVVVVCLSAQVLSVSASPVALPVIAVIVAVALASADLGRAALVRRGLPAGDATLLRESFEASSLVTGALAVALALWRDASGLPTAVAVLVILAAGAFTTAALTGRRRLWWVAAAAATGALWGVWRIAGIDLVEPYVLPPALAAAVVGAVLVARDRGGRALATAGLAVAATSSLVVFGVEGGTLRLVGLLAAGALLSAAAVGLPSRARLDALRRPALLIAVVAAAAGPVQALRIGTGIDPSNIGIPIVACALAAFAGGALAAFAGAAIARVRPLDARWRSRWLLVPALAYALGGTWSGIRSDWPTIWTMWSLMLAVLVGLVAVAWRLRRTDGGLLPPVWVLFAASFATAVVAWSPRELRVEWFSLPLGLAVLIAGALHLGPDEARAESGSARRTLESWPGRWSGSWALLAPGIVTAMSASIVATFTDPLTWRAILVIVMALVAILIGARARLAAPFVIGIVVLPIENVSAFSVQIGRGIESMPWWITLAVVGAVLLIIAVSYERRAGEAEGIADRLRDLR